MHSIDCCKYFKALRKSVSYEFSAAYTDVDALDHSTMLNRSLGWCRDFKYSQSWSIHLVLRGQTPGWSRWGPYTKDGQRANVKMISRTMELMMVGLWKKRDIPPVLEELPNIRLILDAAHESFASRLTQREQASLRRLDRILGAGSALNNSEDLRSLIALGTVSYLSKIRISAGAVPNTLVIDIACSALWPLVTARDLPSQWMQTVSSIHSPYIALSVSQLRTSRFAGAPVTVKEMWTALAAPAAAIGITRLLQDLTDPDGTAKYLIPLAKLAGVKDDSRTPTELLKWAFMGIGGAASAGIIGNRADELAMSTLDWLQSQVDRSAGTSASGDSSINLTSSPGSSKDPEMMEKFLDLFYDR